MDILESYNKNKKNHLVDDDNKHLLKEVTAASAVGAFTGRAGDYIDKKFRSRIIKFCKIYKIKNVGISLYYNNLKYLKKVGKSISTFQIPLNILDQRFLFNQNFINLVKKNKIKLEARSVFLQGFLFKKPSYVFNKFKVSKNFSTIIMKILKKNKISLAELSYSWVYSNKMINKVVVGLNSYNHYLSFYPFNPS